MALRIPTRIASDANFQGRIGQDVVGIAVGLHVVDASLFLLTPRRTRRLIGRVPAQRSGNCLRQVFPAFGL